jgi:hypothetical protein
MALSSSTQEADIRIFWLQAHNACALLLAFFTQPLCPYPGRDVINTVEALQRTSVPKHSVTCRGVMYLSFFLLQNTTLSSTAAVTLARSRFTCMFVPM